MPAPAFEIVPQRHAHWIRLPSFASVYGLSCGRCRYLSSVHRDCVPRKVLTSHSTSMPSAAKKPSSWATKSLMPMPLGATRTFLITPPIKLRRRITTTNYDDKLRRQITTTNYDDKLRRQITTTSGYSRHYTPDKSMIARRLSAKTLRGESARYERPRTAKEAAILVAATEIFGAKGFRDARTADIAQSAGVTERTLFRYFPTKEQLYQRVMFSAVLAPPMPRELPETGHLFASDSESFRDWHRRVLKLRLGAARASAPQFRLVLATLLTDGQLRDKVIAVWRKNLWQHALETIDRFQSRKQLRTDLPREAIARGIISLNLGYIIARALLAPDAPWDDDSEIEATVDLFLRGAAK